MHQNHLGNNIYALFQAIFKSKKKSSVIFWKGIKYTFWFLTLLFKWFILCFSPTWKGWRIIGEGGGSGQFKCAWNGCSLSAHHLCSSKIATSPWHHSSAQQGFINPAGDSFLIPPGPKGNSGTFFMFRIWAQAQGTRKHVKLSDFSSPTPPSFFQKRVSQSLKQIQKQPACDLCQQALKSSTSLNHCTGVLWRTKCHQVPWMASQYLLTHIYWLSEWAPH